VGRPSTEVNLENCTLEEFERTMSCTLSQEDYRRLEAVWFLYRGYSRKSRQFVGFELNLKVLDNDLYVFS
jgi:hypothetical protein